MARLEGSATKKCITKEQYIAYGDSDIDFGWDLDTVEVVKYLYSKYNHLGTAKMLQKIACKIERLPIEVFILLSDLIDNDRIELNV